MEYFLFIFLSPLDFILPALLTAAVCVPDGLCNTSRFNPGQVSHCQKELVQGQWHHARLVVTHLRFVELRFIISHARLLKVLSNQFVSLSEISNYQKSVGSQQE